MSSRNFKMSVRLNEREHEHLCRQTKRSGLSMEALIRNLIMGLDVKPKPSEELCQLRHQVQAIGNNINQIARVANTNRSIDDKTIDELLALQMEIWRLVKSM